MRNRTSVFCNVAAVTGALLLSACSGTNTNAEILPAPPPATERAGQPNIVVIFSDDHGFADLGINGVRDDLKTPHLDALARDGARFERGYVTAPQCSPSRAGLLTGRYQQRFGLDDNTRGPLATEEVTIAERFAAAGYVTAMVGKWHLGIDQNNRENLPAGANPASFDAPNQGFQEYFQGELSRFVASHRADGHELHGAPKTVEDSRYRVDVATEWAESFIKRNAKRPFLLYVPYFAPHVPLEAPTEYRDRFPDVTDETRKIGLAMIAAIDDGVGRIRTALRAEGLESNTLIFFIGDNGAPVIPEQWNGSLNEPFRGEKGMLTEGGIRVPYVIAWPGKIPAGQVHQTPVSSLDVVTTSLAAAGINADPILDGIDLLPLIRDGEPVAERSLYWRWSSQAAVTRVPWKLIRLGDDQEFLFNLDDAAAEAMNYREMNPEMADELRKDLAAWTETLARPGLPTSPIARLDQRFYRFHGLIDD